MFRLLVRTVMELVYPVRLPEPAQKSIFGGTIRVIPEFKTQVLMLLVLGVDIPMLMKSAQQIMRHYSVLNTNT